jgi:DNA (cytosine-5)-methyltransferase 1
MTSTFYNEWDKKTAAWLRELARQGHVTNGVVDERSITELRGEDLRGYGRVHLFAGIGGWDYALKLAGWPDDRPVWTGSCPCQAESVAGKRLGAKDPRHLWPDMFRLIQERRPATVFGEQVARAARTGWIDRVRTDMEAEGYAFGFHVLGAHSTGALHRRQRIYWCADARGVRPQGIRPAAEEPWSGEQLEGLVQAAIRVSVPTGKSGGLSDGVPARVVRLRGYGNAIVPQVAAAFVRAFIESEASQ